MNVQIAIQVKWKILAVLEVNPRALARTVPFVSKSTDIPL